MELEARLDELRALGLSEQQIVDLVHRELMQKIDSGGGAGEHKLAAARPEQAVDRDRQPLNGDVLDVPPESHLRGILVRKESFGGPLPHPDLARQYEQLCPGFTDRQLVLHEKLVEAQIAAGERADDRLSRGQHYALAIGLAMIGLGVVLAVAGEAGWAAAVVGVELTALVGAFLYRERQRSERQLAALAPQSSGKDPNSPAPPTSEASGE